MGDYGMILSSSLHVFEKAGSFYSVLKSVAI